MLDDWLDIPFRGAFEVRVPTLTVTSDEIGTLRGTAVTRRLDTSYHATTRNHLLPPLCARLEFLRNIERLMRLAIDFFLVV